MPTLQEQQHRLHARLKELDSVLVAYSGGVDSAFLAWSAHKVLGFRMLAVLADSPSLAREHYRDALAFAQENGLPLEVIRTAEMDNPDYVRNDAKRCFHCKSELFQRMEEARARLGFKHLAYGMNLDDRGDYRPGQQAAVNHHVAAPLVDAGLDKAGIRQLAREAGLKVWDKPASACLSSRIAYGQSVTPEALGRVEAGEDHLRRLGLRQYRVRDHAGLARIEVAAEELPVLLSRQPLPELGTAFRLLGFTYVTLDCDGFRSGSMNAALAVSAKPKVTVS